MANFVNLQAGVADAMVVGGILVPEFQKEITDIVLRNSILGSRIQYIPATGSPSRWFEQTGIATAEFTNTGGSGGGTITATSGTPTRVEHSVQIKGISGQLTYSLFDLETIAQQNVFPELKAKDMMDMINSIALLHGQALWTGTDTVNGGTVGNGGLQYVGLLNQISTKMTIASGSSIIDSIRTQAATMAASTQYNLLGQKYSIYINPLALDLLEQEAKNAVGSVIRYMETNVDSVGAGLTVSGIRTALGTLPLIPEPFLPINPPQFTAAPTGQSNYSFCIVAESMVEYHYIGSKIPRIFELGTLQNLNSTYTAVMFGAPAVKAGSYAHVIGVIQR